MSASWQHGTLNRKHHLRLQLLVVTCSPVQEVLSQFVKSYEEQVDKTSVGCLGLYCVNGSKSFDISGNKTMSHIYASMHNTNWTKLGILELDYFLGIGSHAANHPVIQRNGKVVALGPKQPLISDIFSNKILRGKYVSMCRNDACFPPQFSTFQTQKSLSPQTPLAFPPS